MAEGQQQKEALIKQLCSSNLTTVQQALSELRKRGWLSDGSLIGACLCEANLSGESLWGANLQDVKLSRANLQGASLQGSELEGTRLDGADLQGVELRSRYLGMASFSADTVLPDGSNWVRSIDMNRFTNPDHPDFWRSDDPDSPAYRDNNDDI